MKKVHLFILIVSIILIFVGCSTRPEKIALLDMEKVLSNSKRAQRLRQELEDIGNDLEIKYQKKQKEVSEDEKVEEELDKISQEYLDNKQRLEELLNQEINDIIAEIAEKDNFSTVLYNETIYYGGFDITEEVIKKLDERYIEGGETTDGQ